MEITEVRVFPVEEEIVEGYVMLTFDNRLVIRDIRIIHGTFRYFLSMPSKNMKDGTHKDIAHPIDKETPAMIESRVLEEYHSPNKPRLQRL